MATDGAWNVGTFLGPSADFDYGVGVLPYMKEKVHHLYWRTKRCILHNRASGRSYGMAEMVLSGRRIPWSLIEAGTWMPILDSWYTDPEKSRQMDQQSELSG